MATYTTHPPVGHGHRDMPVAVVHRSGDTKPTTIAGVTLTPTGLGYTAQGWSIERIEDAPPYWEASRSVSPTGSVDVIGSRSLKRLVSTLVRRGDLVPGDDDGREAA